jgi:hypothetical protein
MLKQMLKPSLEFFHTISLKCPHGALRCFLSRSYGFYSSYDDGRVTLIFISRQDITKFADILSFIFKMCKKHRPNQLIP